MAALKALGVSGREVRVPADLDQLDGLILPGGESTTMMLGLTRERLERPVADFVRSGARVLATCAGTILLDDDHLRLLDISCARNAYGRQAHSFEAPVELTGGASTPGVFIRAPRITRIGDGVEVVATHGAEPVGVRAGNIRAYTFHPELTNDLTIHQEFIA